MDKNDYKRYLDKVRCRDEFRKLMEEKLSDEPSEWHEYIELVDNAENVPKMRTRKLATAAAVLLITCGLGGAFYHRIKAISNEERPEAAQTEATSTTAVTTTVTTTSVIYYNVEENQVFVESPIPVPDIFKGKSIFDGDSTVANLYAPMTYYASDAQDAEPITDNEANVKRIRNKLISTKWEPAGEAFEYRDYYVLGDAVFNENGQLLLDGKVYNTDSVAASQIRAILNETFWKNIKTISCSVLRSMFEDENYHKFSALKGTVEFETEKNGTLYHYYLYPSVYSDKDKDEEYVSASGVCKTEDGCDAGSVFYACYAKGDKGKSIFSNSGTVTGGEYDRSEYSEDALPIDYSLMRKRVLHELELCEKENIEIQAPFGYREYKTSGYDYSDSKYSWERDGKYYSLNIMQGTGIIISYTEGKEIVNVTSDSVERNSHIIYRYDNTWGLAMDEVADDIPVAEAKILGFDVD